MQRYGMTIPFDGVPLHEQRDWVVELADLGYTDVWSSEANGADAFTPLALASVWAPSLRLGTAIVPAFTRGPGCLAQSVGSLAQAAPGRFALGVGTSSNVIVEGWNGIPFEQPYQRTRDLVRSVARGHAASCRARGRRGDRQLAVGRRRDDGGADRPQGRPGRAARGRGPHLRRADRRRRHGARHGPLRRRRVPQRARLRGLPRVAGAGRRARRHVAALEGR